MFALKSDPGIKTNPTSSRLKNTSHYVIKISNSNLVPDCERILNSCYSIFGNFEMDFYVQFILYQFHNLAFSHLFCHDSHAHAALLQLFHCAPSSFNGATSIRRTFKSSKNEKLFNASKEFHISDYFHLVIFSGD